MIHRLAFALLAAAGLVAGCASNPTTARTAQADLKPASGSNVSGVATLAETADGVRITAKLSGLTPGEHGFHIHETGDCSAPDASSAKGHYNPHGKAHGAAGGDNHLGDMPNLVADATGKAEYSAVVPKVRLQGDVGNVLGRALVVHADPDDYRSQPAGNSGKRVACGVIQAR